MRTITVHRISLQFDTGDISDPEDIVEGALEQFTEALQKAFPGEQPQLTTDSEEFNAEDDITVEPI